MSLWIFIEIFISRFFAKFHGISTSHTSYQTRRTSTIKQLHYNIQLKMNKLWLVQTSRNIFCWITSSEYKTHQNHLLGSKRFKVLQVSWSVFWNFFEYFQNILWIVLNYSVNIQIKFFLITIKFIVISIIQHQILQFVLSCFRSWQPNYFFLDYFLFMLC